MSDQASAATDKPRGGVAGLFVSLIAVELVLLAVFWYASYYWTLPVWAIIAYAVLGISTLGLFVLVVSRAKRKFLGLLITAVLVVVIAVGFMLASIAFPAEWLPKEDRIAQIGEEAGVTVLVPEGVEVPAKSRDGYHPSSDLTEGGVVTIEYRDFDLSESASDSVMTAAELEAFIELLQPEPGSGVTLDVSEPQELVIVGRPAIAVTWREIVGAKGAQPPGIVLIFQPEGLVVRLATTPTGGLTLDEAATLAESMEPLK